jgi:hypothetical protein
MHKHSRVWSNTTLDTNNVHDNSIMPHMMDKSFVYTVKHTLQSCRSNTIGLATDGVHLVPLQNEHVKNKLYSGNNSKINLLIIRVDKCTQYSSDAPNTTRLAHWLQRELAATTCVPVQSTLVVPPLHRLAPSHTQPCTHSVAPPNMQPIPVQHT